MPYRYCSLMCLFVVLSSESFVGVTALATREKSSEVEVVWVKIDHMRESAAYLRRLEAWCAQLSLPARLLIARDHGIHFLAYGRCVFCLLPGICCLGFSWVMFESNFLSSQFEISCLFCRIGSRSKN
jgi:hypothetical protein